VTADKTTRLTFSIEGATLLVFSAILSTMISSSTIFLIPYVTLLRCCATNRKVAGSIPADVTRFFIDIKSFRSQYGPGVDSTSNRNEYQEYFLGVKAAGA